uniref:Chloride channel protein n=1 Tax=Ditylum brightwellii TaxID=49249 RepID=A0A6V2KMR1_9STRA
MPSLNLTEDHFDSEDDHTDQGLSTTPRRASSGYRDDPSSFVTPKNSNRILRNRSSHVNIRSDGYGGKENGRYTKLSHIPSAPLNVQSHNYEPDESEVWRAYVAQQHFSNRGQWWTTGKKRSLKRWALTFMVGVIQGILAFLCNMVTRFLSSTKFDHVNALLQAGIETEDVVNARGGNDDMLGTFDDVVDHDTEVVEMEESKGWWSFGGSAFLAFLFYQTLFAGIASFFVYLEPVSGGSGIPEIKCFLNGIDLPRVVRVKTLICKVVGVTFSVAAGLPVGKEGPMVHSGAVVAAGISQGRTKFWGVDTSFSKFSDFRNDREKRDFVACGAAAGVTSAFGAPIGGVLFSLEEGASYWSTKLTWRAFFCAMITLGTLFAVRNFDSLWGQADIDKLFSFGEFNSLSGEASNFSIWELLLSIIIGCLGGLIGAVFNAANEHLTIWRMKHINHSPSRRYIEVVAISIFVTIISFVMPLVWNRCTELPTDMQDWSNQEKNLVEALVPFRCVAGKEYNEVASLIFTDADMAIKQLFHFREAGQDDSSTFSSAALFLFFVPYVFMATIVYGIAIPSGLFVPSLLSGAAFGRLCGHLLHKLDHTSGTFADSGTYALMGAAAVLGGMARMTISLTVILLEATGDMQYVLPLMLTLMAARFTGNVFNEGLYDIHIKLKNIPFLEPEVPTIAERHEIVAGQVMSTDVKCLRPVERAGVVYELLRNYSHGTFPIVDTASQGTLYGTASRSMLCTLLQRRAFGSPDVLSEYDGCGFLGPKRLSPLVQWDTIERAYPRYPTIDDVEMRPGEENCWLDLRPYANTAPHTVNETASIQVG